MVAIEQHVGTAVHDGTGHDLGMSSRQEAAFTRIDVLVGLRTEAGYITERAAFDSWHPWCGRNLQSETVGAAYRYP